MITYLKSEQGFSKITRWEPGCWVKADCPTEEELNELKTRFNLPEDFLSDISDIDERPRVERNDGWICTIIRMPIQGESSNLPLYTIPIGVMVKDEYVLTVCFYKNDILTDFIDHTDKRNTRIDTAADFIVRLLKSSAYWYLQYLKDMKNMVTGSENDLLKTIRNEELLRLMNLQKSFVIFATSISGNKILLERIKRFFGDELDMELFEDAQIELRQADTTVTIATQMLDRTMDTYASVISNNVNAIMKRLTSISLIMMVPTLIASFYGMNVDVGIAMDNPWAFGCIVGVGISLSIIICIWLRKINWL